MAGSENKTIDSAREKTNHWGMVKGKAIAWSEFKFGDDTYHITVRYYGEDQEYVTADWWRGSDRQEGELGYGIFSCDGAMCQAEQEIMKRSIVAKQPV